MKHRVSEILATFHKLNEIHHNNYCFPCQEKILEILNKIYGIRICRRTLNYDLKYIESQGLIQRVRRHKRSKSGNLELHSTLYKITTQGYLFLKKLGINVAKHLKRLGVKFKKAVRDAFSLPSHDPDAIPYHEYLRRKRLKFL